MLKGFLTYSAIASLLAFALTKVLGVDVTPEEVTPAVEAGGAVVLAVVGFYGRWRATRKVAE
jgi:hypothetical protein